MNGKRGSPPQAGRRADRGASGEFLLGVVLLAALFSMGQAHRSSGGVLSTVFWDEFGLSPSLIALLVGSLFIAQGLGQVPGGLFVDRFGTRKTLAFFGSVASAGCVVVAVSGDWRGVLAGRVLIGLGFAPMLSGAVSYFLEWSEGERLSTLTGRFLSMGMIGGLLGTGPLSYAIETFGWRAVYMAAALLTLVFSAIIFFVLKEAPAARDAPPVRSTMIEVVRGFVVVAKSPDVRLILVVAPFLYAPAQLLVGLWAGPYLADIHGLDPVARGTCLTVMMVGMGLGVLVYGPVETLVGRRKPVVICGALTVAILSAALALVGHRSLVLAVLLAAAITLSSTFFVVVIAHAQSMFSKSFSGRSVGMIGLLGVSGIFLCQNVSAWIISLFPAPPGSTGSLGGYQAIFLSMATVFAAIALAYTRTRERPATGPGQS